MVTRKIGVSAEILAEFQDIFTERLAHYAKLRERRDELEGERRQLKGRFGALTTPKRVWMFLKLPWVRKRAERAYEFYCRFWQAYDHLGEGGVGPARRLLLKEEGRLMLVANDAKPIRRTHELILAIDNLGKNPGG